MSAKLSPKDLELYRAVDEVLHYIWDPIGVSDVPLAHDEYHSYLPPVFSLLRNGASEESLAGYLGDVVSDRMGLSINFQHNERVASLLNEWKSVISEKYG